MNTLNWADNDDGEAGAKGGRRATETLLGRPNLSGRDFLGYYQNC